MHQKELCFHQEEKKRFVASVSNKGLALTGIFTTAVIRAKPGTMYWNQNCVTPSFLFLWLCVVFIGDLYKNPLTTVNVHILHVEWNTAHKLTRFLLSLQLWMTSSQPCSIKSLWKSSLNHRNSILRRLWEQYMTGWLMLQSWGWTRRAWTR